MSGAAPSVLSAAAAFFLLAACASAPSPSPVVTDPAAADRAASHALKMVGKPYKYGGSTPTGFDCSGLVQYSYKQAGVSLPRSTDGLLSTSAPLRGSRLRPGDLLFFDQEGKKKSHVGIYLGDGRFVHAPSSGKTVRTDKLDSPYWKKHLSEARRI
jgi:murein DD-endopeptidase